MRSGCAALCSRAQRSGCVAIAQWVRSHCAVGAHWQQLHSGAQPLRSGCTSQLDPHGYASLHSGCSFEGLYGDTKWPQHEDTSICADENALSFTSDNFVSSPGTKAPTDTSLITVRSEQSSTNPKISESCEEKFQVPIDSQKNPRKFDIKQTKNLTMLLIKCLMQSTSADGER